MKRIVLLLMIAVTVDHPEVPFTPHGPGEMGTSTGFGSDMDARRSELTINVITLKQSFIESVTSTNYIGFGVRGAQTQFTEPKVRRNESAS